MVGRSKSAGGGAAAAMAAASNGSEYFEIEAGNESFARPSNAESVAEDEEELMWAAIGRLPSQRRTNTALVRKGESDGRGGGEKVETVDVRKLDRFNRELVVKKALATNDQDNYLLLSAVKERLDKYERPFSLSLSLPSCSWIWCMVEDHRRNMGLG